MISDCNHNKPSLCAQSSGMEDEWKGDEQTNKTNKQAEQKQNTRQRSVGGRMDDEGCRTWWCIDSWHGRSGFHENDAWNHRADCDFLRWQVSTWEIKVLTCAQTTISLLSCSSGPNYSCLNCVQIEGSSETIPPKHAFHWASSVATKLWCS